MLNQIEKKEFFKEIKQKIQNNQEASLTFQEFSYLINKQLSTTAEAKILQEMYKLYKRFDGKKKSGINKGFLFRSLKKEYKTQAEIVNDLKIPPSTQKWWEKENPCDFFTKNIAFFKKIVYLKKQKENTKFLYRLLIKHGVIQKNIKVEKYIKNLSDTDKKLISDYLFWKELSYFKINPRNIAYLFSRVESDYSVWKINKPKIIKYIHLLSLNKEIKKRDYSKFVKKEILLEYNKRLEYLVKVIEELNKTLGKETVNNIMRTYKRGKNKKFLYLLKNYKKRLPIEKKIITRHLYYPWIKGIAKPDAINSLIKIHKSGYHKINKIVLARLLGWGLGDGGIVNTFQYYFICGKKEDLLQIKKYLEKNIPNISRIIIEKNRGSGKVTNAYGQTRKLNSNKDSYILLIRNNTFSRLLFAFGLPNGQKVLQRFNVPLWIKRGKDEVKKAFLDSILECENQKYKVKYIVNKNKIEICATSFGLCKNIKYKKNLILFLKSIRSLLTEFGIECSNVEEAKLASKRKRDSVITCFSRFRINSKAINVIRFSKIINYPFNAEKREALNGAVEEAKNKLTRFNNKKIRYKKAIELHKEGYNFKRISDMTGITTATLKNWIIKNQHLPLYLNESLGAYL